MKILPVSYMQNTVSRHRYAGNVFLETPQEDTFTKLPSFGNAQEVKLAQEVINNPTLRKVFEEFTGNVAVKAFLKMLGIAAGGKVLADIAKANEDEQQDSYVGKLMEIFVKDASINLELQEENSRLKLENEALKQENERLKDQSASEEVVSADDNGSEVAETLLPIFPETKENLSEVMRQLKSVVSGLKLDEEYHKKLGSICRAIVLSEKLEARNNVTLNRFKVSQMLADQLSSVETETDMKGVIDSFFNMLALEEDVESDASLNEEKPLEHQVSHAETGAVDDQTLFPVEFPKRKKPGALNADQKKLKTIVEGIKLSKEDGKKLTEICAVAISDKYKTPSGKSIHCKKILQSLLKDFSDSVDISKIIEENCARLEIDTDDLVVAKSEDVQPELTSPTDGSDEVRGQSVSPAEETPAVSQDSQSLRHAQTPYDEVKTNPLKGPTVLDRIELSPEDRKRRRFPKPDGLIPTQPKQEDNGIKDRSGIVTEEQADDVIDDSSTDDVLASGRITSSVEGIGRRILQPGLRPDALKEQKWRQYLYCSTGGTVDSDLFSTEYYYDRKVQKYKLSQTESGELVKLIYQFKQNLYIHEQELYTYADELIQAAIDSDSNTEGLNQSEPKFLKYIKGDAVPARIDFNDVVSELESNYYKHIGRIYESEMEKFGSPENCPIINQIVEVINGEERFKHFTVHSAMRLLERLVNFESNVPVEQQTATVLDELMKILKFVCKQGVVVDTYIAPLSRHFEKKSQSYETVIKCAPQITLSSKLFNDKQKKIFGSYDIEITFAETRTGEIIIKNIIVQKPSLD